MRWNGPGNPDRSRSNSCRFRHVPEFPADPSDDTVRFVIGNDGNNCVATRFFSGMWRGGRYNGAHDAVVRSAVHRLNAIQARR
jgi:hypothetical protein